MNGAVAGSLLLYPLHVPLWIDLAAVVVGALAGAAIAAREELDVFGALLLAVVMGLGGGIVRDLLLGLRPAAITSPYYLPTVAAAALAGLLFTSVMRRLRGIFVVLEALSDGLFMIVGVGKALYYNVPDVSAIFIGVCAAVGGGILADLLAGRPAAVIQRGPWNATAALVGASVYVTLDALHVDVGLSQAVAFLVVVAMRLSSLRWDLQTPFPPDVAQRLNALRRRKREPAPGSGDDSTDDGSSDGDQPARLGVFQGHLGGHKRTEGPDGKVDVLRGHVADKEGQAFTVEIAHHAEQGDQPLGMLRGDLFREIHGG